MSHKCICGHDMEYHHEIQHGEEEFEYQCCYKDCKCQEYELDDKDE